MLPERLLLKKPYFSTVLRASGTIVITVALENPCLLIKKDFTLAK